MVEYGSGISHGPAGQVGGGGGGTPIVGGPVNSADIGANVSNMFNNAVNTFSTLPFFEQVALILLALLVLYFVARRAF
jgi:hypothetical protein